MGIVDVRFSQVISFHWSTVGSSSFYVDDLVVLDVDVRIGSEGELRVAVLFEADEQVGIFFAKAVDNGRIHKDSQLDRLAHIDVAGTGAANDSGKFTLELDTDCSG